MPREELDDYEDRPVSTQQSKRITAGILAILVGWLGVHKFYLGYTTPGIIQLILGLCFGIGGIIGLIEGIIYLTKSDADFVQTYQVGKKDWF
jgi:TM2 domain-containing membrane protein YozV